MEDILAYYIVVSENFTTHILTYNRFDHNNYGNCFIEIKEEKNVYNNVYLRTSPKAQQRTNKARPQAQAGLFRAA